MEERGVKLGLQLLVAVTLHNLCYFVFSPHMRRVVQVTFQALPSAHVDDSFTHKKSWKADKKIKLLVFNQNLSQETT